MKLLLKSHPEDKGIYAFDSSLKEYRSMTWKEYCTIEGQRLSENKSTELREEGGKCSLWIADVA